MSIIQILYFNFYAPENLRLRTQYALKCVFDETKLEHRSTIGHVMRLRNCISRCRLFKNLEGCKMESNLQILILQEFVRTKNLTH